MSIDEKIQEIANSALPEWTYVFDNWYDASKTASKVKLPVIVELLPWGGSLYFRNGMARNAQSCSIAFLDKVTKDANGSDQSEVYNRMMLAAEEFVRSVNDSGYFEVVESVQYNIIYDQLSTIVTGVWLDITLTELVGRC